VMRILPPLLLSRLAPNLYALRALQGRKYRRVAMMQVGRKTLPPAAWWYIEDKSLQRYLYLKLED